MGFKVGCGWLVGWCAWRLEMWRMTKLAGDLKGGEGT